jgi:hypothetical protein
MRSTRDRREGASDGDFPSGSRLIGPGKQTLTAGLEVQMIAGPAVQADDGAPVRGGAAGRVQLLAEGGVAGAGAALPHGETIQRLFGRHDVTHVAAHTDEPARSASASIGAEAYATGDHVAFATASPSLHTAAHEAAHVVQQRGGVQLSGGVGAAGDRYEQHADQVADLVAQGRSAEHVLDEVAGAGPAVDAGRGAGAPVQRLVAIDGLNATKGVVRQIAQYNDALRATVAGQGRASRIDTSAVKRLVDQLNKIKGALVAPVVGLSGPEQAALKGRVEAELMALHALARPADLAGLISGGGPVAATDAVAPVNPPVNVEAAEPAASTSVAVPGPVVPVVPVVPMSADIEPTEPTSAAAAAQEEVEEADDGVAPGALSVRTRQEGQTRIGFEIEPGGHYSGVATLQGVAAPFINQTLLTFTTQEGQALLEMLLDDPRLEGGRAIFQVEFRTPPLQISDIHKDTSTAIRGAISGLAATQVFRAGQALGAGWGRLAQCNALIQALGARTLSTTGRFKAPADLAQHVTSSINLGAYARLPARKQQALYAKGAGSKTKVELYQKILAALGTGTIDASTRGRNDAAVTVKSSIEAMLAAEQALQLEGADDVSTAMTAATRPTVASVGRNREDKHEIPELAHSVASIQGRGAYPAAQGEGGSGYLAVAEKLQPPLLDPTNHQLRVLVEHRTDELRAAVNQVLAGRTSPVWDEFVQAVLAMDKAR